MTLGVGGNGNWLEKTQKIMHDNKKHIALLVIVLTLLGCASPYKFKPQKDEYEYFFGVKLPVLSDNKKQFIVTDKIKKAIKNVKDYNEVDRSDPAMRQKYLLGSKAQFHDYRKNKEVCYFFDNNICSGFQKNFYKSINALKVLNKKIYFVVTVTTTYHQNGKIKNYDNSIYFYLTEGGFNYGKEYTYSENGKVLFEIDFDKNFSMKLSKVFELAAPFLSKIKDSTSIIDVSRKFDQNIGYWVIQNWETSEIEVADSLGVHKGTNYNLVIIDDKARKVITGEKCTPLTIPQKKLDIDDLIKKNNNQYNKYYLPDLYKKRQKILDSLEIALKNKKW